MGLDDEWFEGGTRVKADTPRVEQYPKGAKVVSGILGPGTDFVYEVRHSRREDAVGVVLGFSDSHGLCYEVRHLDGTQSWYNHEELTPLGPAEFHRRRVAWLGERIVAGRQATEEIKAETGREHSPDCRLNGDLLGQKLRAAEGTPTWCTCGLDEAKAVVGFEPSWETWERVNDTVDRLEVPGGWIYRTRLYKRSTNRSYFPNESEPVAESTVFVPDPSSNR